ncbi:MAG TPA: HNH endonuclease [Gaiellaceae bacterium]
MSSARTKRQLARAFDAQRGACCYCDGACWLSQREHREKARKRLGIPAGVVGATKMLRAALATREHLKRRADGGTDADNLAMACQACNVRRGDSEPDVHRIDMQVLVAAGLHPTNRPPHAVADPKDHLKRGLKALKKLRRGVAPQTEERAP